MAEVTLKLPGIHCEGCISSLRLAVGRGSGISKLDGDAKRKEVTIRFDEKVTDVERIREALADVGYEVED